MRDKLYLGGKAPTKIQSGAWSEWADCGLLRRLVAKYGEQEVRDAICGLARLRDLGQLPFAKPGQKMTLRGLVNAKYGQDALFHRCRITWRRMREKYAPAPKQVHAVLRGMLND